MTGTTRLRIIVGALGLALALVALRTIAQTATIEDFWFETQALADQPWGLASIVDLYVGFAFIAVVMTLVEGSLMAGLLWAAPLLVLGNMWTAVWLILRLPDLVTRLRRPISPNS